MKLITLITLTCIISCTGRSQNKTTTGNDSVQPVDTVVKPSVQHAIRDFDTTQRFDYTVYKEVVSKEALKILKQVLPDWQLPDPKSFEALWFNYYKKDDALVNYIRGDFNCDSQEDYAFILENPSRKELGAWVLHSHGNEYKATELLKLNRGEQYIVYGVEIERRGGQISDFDTTKTVKLPCDAIRVQNLGSASRLYYWNKDKFVYVQESD